MIFPENSDSIIANWNTRSYIMELLEAGVRIFLYRNGFIHSKYLLVDSIFSSVGSPNVDVQVSTLTSRLPPGFIVKILHSAWGCSSPRTLEHIAEVTIQEWSKRNRRKTTRGVTGTDIRASLLNSYPMRKILLLLFTLLAAGFVLVLPSVGYSAQGECGEA